MTQYNVEIWSRDWTLKAHAQIADTAIKIDYLDYEKNKVEVSDLAVSVDDFVRVYNDIQEYAGIVTKVQPKNKQIQIMFTTFDTLLDVDMFIDTTLLASKTMEQFIADYINATYLNNVDTLQNLGGIEVQVLSVTQNAILDVDDNVVKFYDDVILTAFKAYGIRVLWTMDVTNHKIIAKLSTCIAPCRTIEADLQNVMDSTFTLKKTSNTLNKIIVYNQDDMTQKEEYYLTTSGEVTQSNANRIVPVQYKIEKITCGQDVVFADKAYEKAFSIFSKIKYENLIEIECMLDDSLIKPLEWQIGQQASIIKDGTIYSTILTGLELSDTCRLIFGTIRLELTKQLKGRF